MNKSNTFRTSSEGISYDDRGLFKKGAGRYIKSGGWFIYASREPRIDHPRDGKFPAGHVWWHGRYNDCINGYDSKLDTSFLHDLCWNGDPLRSLIECNNNQIWRLLKSGFAQRGCTHPTACIYWLISSKNTSKKVPPQGRRTRTRWAPQMIAKLV